ncbi:dTDP-4-dehydrorhamnose 3,5-epimerase [Marinitoga arctica]
MKIQETEIKGLYIIEPTVYGDNRGWFMETYSKKILKEKGIKIDFVQDNHSYSANKGTLRGIHYQNYPMAQTKLIRCTKGKILDIAVDLRKGSPTYKKWIAIELTEENKKQLLIPKGFGHGFLTLTDNVEVQYKVDEYYSKEHDRSIKYNDPEINIDWNLEKYGIKEPILSEKDKNAPYLKNSDCNFKYQGDEK